MPVIYYVATGRATHAGNILCSYWQGYPCRKGRTEKLDQGVSHWPSRLCGVCDGVAPHSVKQEVTRTLVKRIWRIGMTGIESGFEERLHIGIRNVQGLKTKYDEISKELEGSNLDIAVLRETKEKVTGSELQGKFIHIWSAVGKDKKSNRGILTLKTLN